MSGIIATCGTKVETWNLNGSEIEQLSSTTPHVGRVNVVQWNHNNQVLAAGGADGFITLNHFKGQLLGKLPTPKDEEFADERFNVQSLSLSVGSRYLCSGGRDQLVKVWDLKTQRLIRKFESHTGVVTAVSFNRKDSVIASADLKGQVMAHSVASGDKVWHLSAIDKAGQSIGVSHLSYSPFVASRLATSCVEGSVQVWDVATGVQSCNFPAAHTAATSSLFFSPVNQLLLVSTGLDHKVNFFDSHDSKNVMALSAPQPLTAGTFLQDGTTVVVGTRSGALYMYDLRKPNTIKATHLLGPASEISFIARQSKVKAKSKKTVGGRGSGSRATTPKSSGSGTLASKLVDSSSKVIVGPSSAEAPTSRTAASGRAAGARTKRPKSTANTPRGDADVTSKRRVSKGGGSGKEAAGSSTKASSLSSTTPAADADSEKIAGASTKRGAKAPSRIHSTDKPAKTTQPEKPAKAAKAAAKPPTEQPAPKPTQSHNGTTSAGLEQSVHAAKKTETPSPPAGAASSRPQSSAAGRVPEHDPNFWSADQGAGKQLSFASPEAILDQMEEDKEELRDEIRQLHLEMLRQFQLQQTENTKQMQAMMTRMQELFQENRTLREENARLKSVY